MACELPPLKDYLAAADEGRLYKAVDPSGKYAKFKYTEHTVFAADWDPVTLNARGHVFDLASGRCVLRPWSKFFNYQEVFQPSGEGVELTGIGKTLASIAGMEPTIASTFYAMDKLDGALCIAGLADGSTPLVTSSGSFESTHAVWCYRWLLVNGVTDRFRPGYTYLFEMIADDDPHPIRYDFEGCVLLGIVDNATGIELPYGELSEDRVVTETGKVRVADLVVPPGTKSVDEALDYVLGLPASKEGIVLTFDGGFKLKMKGKEFLALQRLFHSLSPRYLMENFDVVKMKFKPEVLEAIPEEFAELKDFAGKTRLELIDWVSRAYGLAYVMQSQDDMSRREIYETVSGMLSRVPVVGGKLVGLAMDCYGKLSRGETSWEALARGRQELVDFLGRTLKETQTNKEDDDV